MSHRKRVWTISHHKDGDHIELYEYGLKSRIILAIETAWDELDAHVFRHALCGNQDWMWKIPFSLKRDEDGDWTRSLGLSLYNLSTRVYTWAWKRTGGDKVASIPVDREKAAELWPEMAWLILAREDDDD